MNSAHSIAKRSRVECWMWCVAKSPQSTENCSRLHFAKMADKYIFVLASNTHTTGQMAKRKTERMAKKAGTEERARMERTGDYIMHTHQCILANRTKTVRRKCVWFSWAFSVHKVKYSRCPFSFSTKVYLIFTYDFWVQYRIVNGTINH